MPHVDLLELPYFEGIPIDSVVALVDVMEPKFFPPGALIVQEGDRSPQPLYIATTGRVAISKNTTVPGAERNLAELDSPTLFGEIELFCQIPPVATARAITPVNSFMLTRPTFDRLFAAQHGPLLQFTFNVARVACHRLAIADEMLTHVLSGEDLVKLRRAVFARMGSSWSRTTGTFKKP